MIIGNPLVFAIESAITQAYERLSFRGIGFFVIYVGGLRFGVSKPDATMLACSFDQVAKRLSERGQHSAPFANEPNAGKIADAFRRAMYAEEDDDESVSGMPLFDFRKLFHTKSIDRMWVPDGDEAFNDGSYILHFDVKDRVRLIAFKADHGYGHRPETLRDVWMAADDFYGILQRWRDAFEAEWTAMPKVVG